MARNRAGNGNTTQTVIDKQTVIDTPRRVGMATALNLEDALAVLAGSKQRGGYDVEFTNFLTSGEPGVVVSLTEGQFAGKKAQSVKTGFTNAQKRIAEKGTEEQKPIAANVRVILNEDKVYLIRQDLVGASA